MALFGRLFFCSLQAPVNLFILHLSCNKFTLSAIANKFKRYPQTYKNKYYLSRFTGSAVAQPKDSEADKMERRSGKNADKEKTFRRLPKCIVPTHYNLSFQPDEHEPILDGRMSVRIQFGSQLATAVYMICHSVMCDTKEVVINGLNINVAKAEYSPESSEGSDGKQEAKDIFVDKDSETIQIEFPTALKAGFGLLSLEFDAQITDNMKGLYRTQITGVDGKSRYNYITHFEPVNARRCFPCFDEPTFKATFDMTLIVPKNVVALANMPLKSEKPHDKDEKLRVCTYETTPIMSTYLIAFVIGEFDFVETTNDDGILVRVYTPPGKKEQGEFSLTLAAKALTYYKDYFGIPYPIPKCDLVAIREFPIGAMENYGLVTFRDTRLLVDPQETSAICKQWVCLVVSHELAHMWFGNLVTMKWWTDLWLKEGFANFIEYLCVDKFFPEFDCWTQFATDNLISALETDSLKSSHPIEVPVTDPSEIDEIFDSISYDKGASIINMLYNFIGDECFRKGMNIYLTRFQYKNSETIDLWDALGEASGKPIGEMMGTFTTQMGFPIINVLKVEQDQATESRTFTLKQEKFWADPKLYSEENLSTNANYKWLVPLTFCKGSKPKSVAHNVLFDGIKENTTKIVVPDIGGDEWVKLNAGMVGYYRVRYSSEMLAQFLPAIQDKSMSPLDRLGLLDDLYATVRSGHSSATDILSLLTAFKNEDNYTVWTSIRDIVTNFAELLLRTELLDQFKTYGISLFKPLKERIGWEAKPNESHTDGLLRSLVISRLVFFGDEETISEAKKFFELHVAGEKMVPADLRSSVYKAVLSRGDSETLELMLNIYRETELSEEKVRILQSLGAVTSKPLLQKILDFSISKEVKPSDIASILFSLSSSKEGQDLNWKFLKDNIALIQERYPGGNLVCHIVRSTTGHFTSEAMATEVETFFNANKLRGTERTVKQVLEKIRVNAAWLNRDLHHVATTLNSK